MRHKVCFITRADAQIGAGHLHRLAILAREFQQHQCAIFWHITPTTAQYYPNLIGEIIQNPSPDYHEFHAVFIDDYGYDAKLRRIKPCLILLNDAPNAPFHADFMLDQNPSALEFKDEYQQLSFNPQCQFLLGLKYCLIKSQIRDLPAKQPKKIENILIALGLAQGLSDYIKWHDAICQLIAKHPNFNFRFLTNHHFAVPSNCQLIQPHFAIHQEYNWADAAIGGGGISAYERVFCQIPSLICILATNQLKPMQALASQTQSPLILSPEALALVNFADGDLLPTPKLIDGRGANRVAQIIISKISL